MSPRRCHDPEKDDGLSVGSCGMNTRLLIDSIVRQTTVLIAQLATSGGVRAPLAHIANQVFLELAAELDAQGVSRKVSADMFGMALRTYLRKIQRLSESHTEGGRSLWEAMLDYLNGSGLVTRADVLQRFHRDDEALVRGVLRDLTESGLVFCSGTGADAVFRAASAEELGHMRQLGGREAGIDELLWALIYRSGPLTREALLGQTALGAAALDSALQRLLAGQRIQRDPRASSETYVSRQLYIPLGATAGWEAAVFDHFQAVVKTVCCRLRQGTDTRTLAGGSTYTFDVWPGHPLAETAYSVLHSMRTQLSELRQKIEEYNQTHGVPEEHDQVLVYAGQCVLSQPGES